LPADERIDFVSIVTPNFLQRPSTTLLKAGFHVVCDKPMTLTVKEAKALRDTVRRSGKVLRSRIITPVIRGEGGARTRPAPASSAKS